jgi:hypothetical protein
MSVGHKE